MKDQIEELTQLIDTFCDSVEKMLDRNESARETDEEIKAKIEGAISKIKGSLEMLDIVTEAPAEEEAAEQPEEEEKKHPDYGTGGVSLNRVDL